jgi:hypothetical protein
VPDIEPLVDLVHEGAFGADLIAPDRPTSAPPAATSATSLEP